MSNIDEATPSTVVDEEAHCSKPNPVFTKSPARTSQPITNQNRLRSSQDPSLMVGLPQQLGHLARHCLTNVGQNDTGRRSTRTFNESLDTQSSNAPRMKSAIQDYLQPERLTQGDTQTQAPLRARPPFNAFTVTPGSSTTLPRRAVDSAQPAVGKLALRPEVAARLRAKKATLYKKATQLVAPKQKRIEDKEIVMCQCGYDGEDDAMVCALRLPRCCQWLTSA